MGRFRGGLRCIKYLLLGFNLLFWVRPGAEGPGRAGAGRGAGSRGPWRTDRCGRPNPAPPGRGKRGVPNRRGGERPAEREGGMEKDRTGRERLSNEKW